MNSKPLWDYIKERENIRLKKERGEPFPWTKDKVLRKFKFTNVRRFHDRTTQAFLPVYAKHAKAEPAVALYNCGVRRFFGTAAFSEALGWSSGFSRPELRKAVSLTQIQGVSPYTGAYMVRGGASGRPKVEAIGDYLQSLWKKCEEITRVILATSSWEEGYRVMVTCYGFGGNGFMAKEVLQDYLLWLGPKRQPGDARTWTPVGPGARRGLNRLAKRDLHAHLREEEYIAEIKSIHPELERLFLLEFPKDPLGLTAHDVQFCACELEKYLRTKNGEGRPRSLYHVRPEPPHLRGGIEVA